MTDDIFLYNAIRNLRNVVTIFDNTHDTVGNREILNTAIDLVILRLPENKEDMPANIIRFITCCQDLYSDSDINKECPYKYRCDCKSNGSCDGSYRSSRFCPMLDDPDYFF